MDFAVPADHGVKMKESEKKYPDFACEMKKKMWNMKVMIIPIVICAGLVQGLWDLEITWRAETIETTALLRSARRVLEPEENLLSLEVKWKIIS